MKNLSFFSVLLLISIQSYLGCKLLNVKHNKTSLKTIDWGLNLCNILDSLRFTENYNYGTLKKRTKYYYVPIMDSMANSIVTSWETSGFRVITNDIDANLDSIMIGTQCEEFAVGIYKKRLQDSLKSNPQKRLATSLFDSIYKSNSRKSQSCFKHIQLSDF